MKVLCTLFLCFCGSALFAQDGFFLQPEVGGGISNTRWNHTSPLPYPENGQSNIFSCQGLMEVGYKYKRWEFVTGAGYLRTGYAGPDINWIYSSWAGGGLIGSEPMDYPNLGESITYNRHVVVPVKVGYQLFHLGKKLTFTACLGAEFAYNMPREYYKFDQKIVESQERFDRYCYRYCVFGLTQFNFEYKVSKHIELIAGLSGRYQLSALVRNRQEYDYAALINLGMGYNFGRRNEVKAEIK